MNNFKMWEMDCWDGYKKAGTKKGKGGKRVNNCVKEDDIVPPGFHKMPDGSIMPDDEMDDDELKELGPAAMKRAKARKASLDKAMKKYGDATKMGMNPADVNQRRNKPTLKKR
tara:strand:+ start:985 stop:1323 length:339 start_codon:yes stop_codon:yes gene_type:complete